MLTYTDLRACARARVRVHSALSCRRRHCRYSENCGADAKEEVEVERNKIHSVSKQCCARVSAECSIVGERDVKKAIIRSSHLVAALCPIWSLVSFNIVHFIFPQKSHSRTLTQFECVL